MNINIALNTIIYIMVFLFPGVLFRKFYYIGKHRKQFGHGNLFERFLITIITSLGCIFFFILFFHIPFLDKLKYEYFNYIEYNNFICLFSNLTENKFPQLLTTNSIFNQLTLVVVFLYIFSSLFGFTLYLLIFYTKIDRYLPFLRFTNEWDYLFYDTRKGDKKIKKNKIFSINIDVLTKTKENEVLFHGVLNQVMYNKDDELESITLKHTYKQIELDRDNLDHQNEIMYILNSIEKKEEKYLLHKDFNNHLVFYKAINSFFVINKSEIVNYSISYITLPSLSESFFAKKRNKLSKDLFYIILKSLLRFALVIIFTELFIMPFTYDLPKYFHSNFNRFLFSSYSFFLAIATNGSINYMFKIKKISTVLNQILLIIAFGVFYLWFFDIVSLLIRIIIILLVIILIGIISFKYNKPKIDILFIDENNEISIHFKKHKYLISVNQAEELSSLLNLLFKEDSSLQGLTYSLNNLNLDLIKSTPSSLSIYAQNELIFSIDDYNKFISFLKCIPEKREELLNEILKKNIEKNQA